eukprot:GHVN01092384.1.p3 GENE.GHVN01092384.1~~GHVN01092384.1.p3  ORF type:complete len:108 (+),score=18.60 GHVN01092384.1:789-1112(+)
MKFPFNTGCQPKKCNFLALRSVGTSERSITINVATCANGLKNEWWEFVDCHLRRLAAWDVELCDREQMRVYASVRSGDLTQIKSVCVGCTRVLTFDSSPPQVLHQLR